MQYNIGINLKKGGVFISFGNFREPRTPRVRVIILILVFIAFIVAFVSRLLSLQIANSDYYKELAVPRNTKSVLVETTRGEIVDRNGTRLVANRPVNCIRLNRSLLPYGKENETLLTLLRFFDSKGVSIYDAMPVGDVSPYRFSYPKDSSDERQLKTFSRTAELKDDFNYSSLYEFCLERYKVEKNIANTASDSEIRRVVGLRYTLEANDFSIYTPYILVENADIVLISELSEILHTMPGVETATTTERYYPGGSLAAHILGRTGPIFPEEAEEYIQKGYSLGATVGKDGAESAFEDYLKSKNGFKIVEYSADGKDILNENYSEKNAPVFGKTVTLTLSAGMQKEAEDALKQTIDAINISNIRSGNPNRASGAVVAQNPNTGEIYVSASYPTYDQNTYRQTVSDMLTDKSRPLLNRATKGIYPPGSTFKIATAAAALSEGIINANTSIYDSGIYREYEDYQPHCWYFDRYGVGHGWQNVVDAIMNSCNIYFFETGRRLGTEALNSYAARLGLGDKTGIETGEEKGILAGPEYRASQGRTWGPGDLIQSAIGQSDNSFTPVQLASFMSTVVNGGTRYKSHILKSVNDFSTGEVIVEAKPEVVDKIEIADEHLELLKRGMKSVVEDGTAASVFMGYEHSVGGKTGTAQRGSGDDNAVFAGFAPYETPEIVVSVVIEAGEHSYTAARVAKSVFDYYFDNVSEFSD